MTTPSGRLAHYRQAAGMTQNQLAAKTGIPQSRISHFETGERDLAGTTARTLLTLARALGVSAEELLEDEPTRPL